MIRMESTHPDTVTSSLLFLAVSALQECERRLSGQDEGFLDTIERIGHDGERTTNRPFHRSKHGPREHSACSKSESAKNRKCTPNWGIPRFRRAVGFLRENGD